VNEDDVYCLQSALFAFFLCLFHFKIKIASGLICLHEKIDINIFALVDLILPWVVNIKEESLAAVLLKQMKR